MVENRLKSIRNEQGLPMRGLAVRAHVSAATICDVERFGYVPTAPTREKIAVALKVDQADIWPALPEDGGR